MLNEREILGLVIAPAPFVGPPVLAGVAALVWQFHSALFWLVLATVIAGYITTLAVGVPVHLLLRRMNRQRLADYLLATFAAVGILIAAAAIAAGFYNAYELAKPEIMPSSAGLAMAEVENPFGPPPTWGRVIWAVIVLGLPFEIPACISAAIFWRIAIRQTE